MQTDGGAKCWALWTLTRTACHRKHSGARSCWFWKQHMAEGDVCALRVIACSSYDGCVENHRRHCQSLLERRRDSRHTRMTGKLFQTLVLLTPPDESLILGPRFKVVAAHKESRCKPFLYCLRDRPVVCTKGSSWGFDGSAGLQCFWLAFCGFGLSWQEYETIFKRRYIGKERDLNPRNIYWVGLIVNRIMLVTVKLW